MDLTAGSGPRCRCWVHPHTHSPILSLCRSRGTTRPPEIDHRSKLRREGGHLAEEEAPGPRVKWRGRAKGRPGHRPLLAGQAADAESLPEPVREPSSLSHRPASLGTEADPRPRRRTSAPNPARTRGLTHHSSGEATTRDSRGPGARPLIRFGDRQGSLRSFDGGGAGSTVYPRATDRRLALPRPPALGGRGLRKGRTWDGRETPGFKCLCAEKAGAWPPRRALGFSLFTLWIAEDRQLSTQLRMMRLSRIASQSQSTDISGIAWLKEGAKKGQRTVFIIR
ncbi:uncharacterized protein LOC132647175 [Meriones unguiculatus]|uniref:uncharacterized protein LOC132647175 n=1 Tax=Meriones unguiculatus TaxID=10047 RepID=UPI00293E77C4|nr:uncharacterized protein LOC132647175 [Meriones unguiculatus]